MERMMNCRFARLVPVRRSAKPARCWRLPAGERSGRGAGMATGPLGSIRHGPTATLQELKHLGGGNSSFGENGPTAMSAAPKPPPYALVPKSHDFLATDQVLGNQYRQL